MKTYLNSTAGALLGLGWSAAAAAAATASDLQSRDNMALGPHALVAALPFHNLLLFTLFLPWSISMRC
jgi:uncharacterized protein YceK